MGTKDIQAQKTALTPEGRAGELAHIADYAPYYSDSAKMSALIQKMPEIPEADKVELYEYVKSICEELDGRAKEIEFDFGSKELAEIEEKQDCAYRLKGYIFNNLSPIGRFAAGLPNISFTELYAEAQKVKNTDLISKLDMISASIISPTFGDECGLGKHDLGYAEGHFDENGQFIAMYFEQYNNPDRHNSFDFEKKEFHEVKDSKRPDWSYDYSYPFASDEPTDKAKADTDKSAADKADSGKTIIVCDSETKQKYKAMLTDAEKGEYTLKDKNDNTLLIDINDPSAKKYVVYIKQAPTVSLPEYKELTDRLETLEKQARELISKSDTLFGFLEIPEYKKIDEEIKSISKRLNPGTSKETELIR